MGKRKKQQTDVDVQAAVQTQWVRVREESIYASKRRNEEKAYMNQKAELICFTHTHRWMNIPTMII